jgi:hypothetical protein
VASTDSATSDGIAVPAKSRRVAPAGRRTVYIRGREYAVSPPSIRDPRLHVAAVLLTLQVLGQTVLQFRLSVAQILVCLIAGGLIEFLVVFFKDKAIIWPASGLLTGNSTAFLLRVPGTLHGDWWSLHGIWIFLGVVAISMASKYLIRWRGRHIFNPSNLGLVLAFVALGPRYTEPLDLWWAPMGPWMIATYAILIGGGLLIGWELRLLGLELGFMAAFALFVALALSQAPDHCLVASWHATPICGRDLWTTLVTSPEILIFALFMIPDPKTVPDGPVARIVFGVFVAFLAVLLLGPTTLEFWTKTAILASLVIACALRFALVRFLAPFEEEGGGLPWMFARFRWRVPAGLAVALICVGCLPISADLSTHSPLPAAELSDGSTPKVTLVVGSGPSYGTWVAANAGSALPAPSNTVPVSASSRVWVLPSTPAVGIPSNIPSFDPSITAQVAAAMGHDVVLDLVIESEARRTHDTKLAATGAVGDGLKEFVDVINQDVSAGKSVQKTYSFSGITLSLFLPKFATQAPRLVGITLNGTATLVTRDASGKVLSQTSSSYSKSWGLGTSPDVKNQVIAVDYTGLVPAN